MNLKTIQDWGKQHFISQADLIVLIVFVHKTHINFTVRSEY